MDKQRAQMGSHENMMKMEGAKDAKTCTLACVKDNGSFALLDPQTKKVYSIENSKKVANSLVNAFRLLAIMTSRPTPSR